MCVPQFAPHPISSGEAVVWLSLICPSASSSAPQEAFRLLYRNSIFHKQGLYSVLTFPTQH